MTRYIDADGLYETLSNLWDNTDSEDFEKGVFKTIINAPTADVVEVVRCRECKHLYKAIGSIVVNGEKETFIYDGLCGATYPNVTVRDFDHYCSYGERR